MQVQEQAEDFEDQWQEDEAPWDEFGEIDMQNGGLQEQGANGEVDLPPQVQ